MTSLFSTYLQVLRAPSAYATTQCGADVASDTDFDAAIAAFNSGGCDTIIVGGDVYLNTADSTMIDFTNGTAGNSLTIKSNGSNKWTIDGNGYRPILAKWTTGDSLTIANLTIAGSGSNLVIEGGAIRAYDPSQDGGDFALDNVTISGSTAKAAGAAWIQAVNVVVTGSVFVDNDSFNGDAGTLLFDVVGDATVVDSTFTDNRSIGQGAAIVAEVPLLSEATLAITGCTFTDNYSYGQGGAIYADYVALTVTDSTFTNNRAGYWNSTVYDGYSGGAIYQLAAGNFGTLHIDGSTFTDNSSTGYGGAVFSNLSTGADTEITDSTFSANYALYGGGAVYTYYGLAIEGTTFTSNTTDGSGGAIYVKEQGYLTVGKSSTNPSLLTLNEANAGGGAVFALGGMNMTDSTVDQNASATFDGGGVYLKGDSTISGSAFTANEAYRDGSAVWIADYDLTISGSSFTSNQAMVNNSNLYAVSGGTIVAKDAATEIVNSFIGGNSVDVGGNASAIIADGGALALEFSTVYNNAYMGVVDVAIVDADWTVTGSVIGNGTPSFPVCDLTGIGSGTLTDQFAVSQGTGCGFTGTGSHDGATGISLGAVSTQAVNGVTQSFRTPATSSLLATGAPTSALGTGVTQDQVGTSRVGRTGLTIGSIEVNPASGGGGGGGGGSTTEPTPTPTPSPTVTPAPVADPLLPGNVPGVATLLPPKGLPAGHSLLVVNGQQTPVTVKPNNKMITKATALDVTGPGFDMRLAGRGDVNDPLGLTAKQALILQSEPVAPRSGIVGRMAVLAKAKVQPVAESSGSGFMANSEVKLFLLQNTYLGTLMTDAQGNYSGRVPVPAGIQPGTYTLQANGFTPTGEVRSLNLGVVVTSAATAQATRKASAEVFFAPLSAELSTQGKVTLDKLVKKTGKSGVKTTVIGFVQPVGTTANDTALSKARAQVVAQYLRSKGLQGAYVIKGNGRAKETGAQARRVEVTVTFRK